ncbi:hypothetical protein [Hydrogenimonas sp.]
MSIKEQVEFAKEELTQDEKLLAGLIRVERFYRKNRVSILAIVALVLVGGIGYGVLEYMHEQKLYRANEALLTLEKNPSDAKALKILKEENPGLFSLYEVRRAIASEDTDTLKRFEKSEDPVVADMASYHLAAFEKSLSALKAYRMKSDVLLKDFALIDEAYLLMKKGETEEAKERLKLVPSDSPLKAVSELLSHYGVSQDRGDR